MSISFLRISPKPFPPFCYPHTAHTHTYLLPGSGSHGCQGSDSSRLPHEKCRSGGRRWRTDSAVSFTSGHVPGPAPMMRRRSDIVGLSGLGKCCSSKQVEARRRNWASVLAAYQGLPSSSSHPRSSPHYRHSSIVYYTSIAATTSIHFLPVVPKLLGLVVNIPKTRRAS